MALKQISLTMPSKLLQASKTYCTEFGYRNVQELIIEMMRDRIWAQNIDRYKAIEARMKKGIGVKTFNQRDAIQYLRNL